MIAQIFKDREFTLQKIVNYSKTPQRRGFRLAAEIVKRLISNKIDYTFIIQDDIVYFEELDKDGFIVEVVGLDLNTGKYVVVNLEEYLEGGY
jgi:hypothetical protein